MKNSVIAQIASNVRQRPARRAAGKRLLSAPAAPLAASRQEVARACTPSTPSLGGATRPLFPSPRGSWECLGGAVEPLVTAERCFTSDGALSPSGGAAQRGGARFNKCCGVSR